MPKGQSEILTDYKILTSPFNNFIFFLLVLFFYLLAFFYIYLNYIFFLPFFCYIYREKKFAVRLDILLIIFHCRVLRFFFVFILFFLDLFCRKFSLVLFDLFSIKIFFLLVILCWVGCILLYFD